MDSGPAALPPCTARRSRPAPVLPWADSACADPEFACTRAERRTLPVASRPSPVSLALPKSHPHANKAEIPLALMKEEPFIGLNRMYPNYGDWLLKACRRAGFKPRIVKEADGAASALAFVAAGFGVAVVSEPLQKIPAKDVVFRALTPEDSAWVPVGAAWKPDALTAPVTSRFVDILAQTCAGGNGGGVPLRIVV